MPNVASAIRRREFLERAAAAVVAPVGCCTGAGVLSALADESSLRNNWLPRWEKNIVKDARNRYCDREMGEEIGWLISPFLKGFYYGYLATQDPKWADMLVDWADAWIKRGVNEPDGCIGWPKADGASTGSVPDLYTDNMLGEAMGLHPIALMADVILKTPSLQEKHGPKARQYIKLAEDIFQKWDDRGCWREIRTGGVWVVPTFGIDRQTGKWNDGYDKKGVDGFSLPANKQNFIALWLLAMHQATQKPLYRQRAEKWWQTMKSRMRLRENGKYFVWNYWDPAGPWDSKPDGTLKHWVGVHPNGGYYGIDAEGIVTAYEHDLVFAKEDLDRLIATNRDFMWNKQVEGAKFQRIDGGKPDPRWANSPGVLWTALVWHDETLRKIFQSNHNPENWGGLSSTPWYFAPRAAS